MDFEIKNKNVFLSAFFFVSVAFIGMFGSVMVHSVATPLTINEMVFYEYVCNVMVDIGASYCILFVTIWIIKQAHDLQK